MSIRKIIGGCLVASIVWPHSPSYAAYEMGEWELTPCASVQEEYDSNITYAHSDVLSDFITTPQIGLEGTYTGKNDSAKISTSVEEQIYSRYSQYDNTSEYFNGSYQKDLDDYNQWKVSDNFEHAADPTNFAAQFGRVNGRYEYYDNTFNTSFSHDFTDKLNLQAKFLNDYYSPQMAGLVDSTQYQPGLELDYEALSELKVLSYYDYTYRNFAQYGSMSKNTIGMGLRHYWTPRIYLEGKVGEDFIQPVYGSNTARPQYIVALNDAEDQRTLYTLSYTKQYQDTPYSPYLFNNWQVGLEVKRDMSERWTLYASAFTGNGVYVGEALKERFTGVGGGAIYHVSKNIDVRIDYRFSDNNSNVSADSYQKNTALLALSFKF